MKSDIVGMKAALNRVDETVTQTRDDLLRVEVNVVRTRAGMENRAHYVHEKLVTKNGFHERMDAYADRIDDFRFHAAHQKERLDDLEAKSAKS